MNNVIEVNDLSKSFKKTDVLKGVSFSVPAGQIFALLSPNGAGKTTTIRILCTLTKSDGSCASILGEDVGKNHKKVWEMISLTGQHAAVDDILSGRENLLLI